MFPRDAHYAMPRVSPVDLYQQLQPVIILHTVRLRPKPFPYQKAKSACQVKRKKEFGISLCSVILHQSFDLHVFLYQISACCNLVAVVLQRVAQFGAISSGFLMKGCFRKYPHERDGRQILLCHKCRDKFK